MVKVQKPQPKSLNKTQKIDGISKEKLKLNKITKTKTNAGVVEAVADIKKKNASTKSANKKTIEKKTKVITEAKASVSKPTPKSKTSKKPLVLAPPESPAAQAPKVAKRSESKAAASIEAPVPKATKKPASALKAIKKSESSKNKAFQATPPSSIKKTESVEAPASKAEKKAASGNAKKAVSVASVLKAGKTSEPVAKAAKKTAAVAVPKTTKRPPQSETTVEEVATKKSKTNIAKSTQAEGNGKSTKKQTNLEKKEEKKVKPEKNKITGKKNVGKVLGLKQSSPKQKQLVKGTKKVKSEPTNVAKAKSKKQAPKKQKKQNLELNFELKPFDEDKFYEIVKSNVHSVCNAIKIQASEELERRKMASIFTDYRYILQVGCYKIPSAPKRVVKLALKNSLVGSDDDVAIIVPDLQRGARFDYEPTVQHYEDLFREAGVEQRLTVVPFNRLRNDLGSFEAKRKFLNSFDYLLCDGRISGQTTAFFGIVSMHYPKAFQNTFLTILLYPSQASQKPRNVLHAVRLSKENALATEISRALKRTAYRQLRKGDLTAIPVGNHEHSGQELAENILTVIKQLEQHYAGGLANIRSIYLKIDIVGTSALPLYISVCSPPADTPYVVGPREQRMLKLKKQANEVLTRFALTKDVEFVKLTPAQVQRKAELMEKRKALKTEDKNAVNGNDDGKEQSAAPAKKVKKAIEPVKSFAYEDDENDEDDDDDEDVEDDDEEDHEEETDDSDDDDDDEDDEDEED